MDLNFFLQKGPHFTHVVQHYYETYPASFVICVISCPVIVHLRCPLVVVSIELSRYIFGTRVDVSYGFCDDDGPNVER